MKSFTRVVFVLGIAILLISCTENPVENPPSNPTVNDVQKTSINPYIQPLMDRLTDMQDYLLNYTITNFSSGTMDQFNEVVSKGYSSYLINRYPNGIIPTVGGGTVTYQEMINSFYTIDSIRTKYDNGGVSDLEVVLSKSGWSPSQIARTEDLIDMWESFVSDEDISIDKIDSSQHAFDDQTVSTLGKDADRVLKLSAIFYTNFKVTGKYYANWVTLGTITDDDFVAELDLDDYCAGVGIASGVIMSAALAPLGPGGFLANVAIGAAGATWGHYVKKMCQEIGSHFGGGGGCYPPYNPYGYSPTC